jgi:proteic killer suppression protein
MLTYGWQGHKKGKDESRTLPRNLWLRAKALMTIMHYTSTLDDLRIKGQPPNIRLHKLKGDRKDVWSVTIELPWCITFKYKNAEFSDVRIENYHKG